MSKILEGYVKEAAKKGAKEAEERSPLSNLRTLMETMNLTAEQAMDALRVPIDERGYYKARL